MQKTIRKFFRKFGYDIIKYNSGLGKNPFFDQVALMGNTVNKKLTIFDVGGHQGQTATNYLNLFPESLIYTFEPFSASFEKLTSTINKHPKIFPFKLALGNECKTTSLNINKNSATNSIFPTHPEGEHIWGKDLLNTVTSEEIKMLTLDEFAKQKSIEKINILKLDTQGSEYLVLEGAKELIKQKKIDLIYTELIVLPTYKHQLQLSEYLSLFNTLDFELYNFYNLSLTKEGKLRQVDAIFISSSLTLEKQTV